MRTTGQTFVGASGGLWAELDVNAGEKKGKVINPCRGAARLDLHQGVAFSGAFLHM